MVSNSICFWSNTHPSFSQCVLLNSTSEMIFVALRHRLLFVAESIVLWIYLFALCITLSLFSQFAFVSINVSDPYVNTGRTHESRGVWARKIPCGVCLSHINPETLFYSPTKVLCKMLLLTTTFKNLLSRLNRRCLVTKFYWTFTQDDKSDRSQQLFV